MGGPRAADRPGGRPGPAGHGDRQRHARQLLRRRPARPRPRTPRRTPAGWSREGADLLDVGGESSRPGSEPVPLDEELRRVVPAVEAIAASVAVPISVDTTKAEVARQAIEAGASVVNDITALAGDPDAGRASSPSPGRGSS